jgi:hypothetical protein
VVTGLLTNLLPVLGELGLLMVGGLSFILSFLMMVAYGRKWSSGAVGVGAGVYD